MKQKFVIYAHSFNMNNGGVIVLHQLCHILNTLGYDAYLWIHKKPVFSIYAPFSFIHNWIKYLFRKPYKTYEFFNTPIATSKELKNAIVVYPEILDGNPLNSTKVVRWLLHKPGFHSGRINFSPNELIVGYGQECSGSGIEITNENSLVVKFIMEDIYKQTNFASRNGCCHMIRKGKSKEFVHPENSILVDSLSHQELSKIFNQMETFISYDTYTYYSTYAALCGCISIVIPDENISKEEWYIHEKDRYGKAYGLNDIDYAISTKTLMLDYIQEQNDRNYKSVTSFANLCQHYFK